MNKEREIARTLKEVYKGKETISREELKEYFISINPNITPEAIRNRIYHLVRFGTFYAITNNLYAFSNKQKWSPNIDDKIVSIWENTSIEFAQNEFCFWTTKWYNEFTNLQAFNEIIVIEVDGIVAESFYHKLAVNLVNVYYQPNEKEIEYYITTKDLSCVIRPIITRAPIIKQDTSPATKRSANHRAESPPISKLEKLLTDLYYDKNLLIPWKYEEVNIWQTVFNKYNLNFSIIYNYAKRRDSSVKIFDFILNNVTNLPNDIIRYLQERRNT
ncbi:MAG: hypothetical protein GXO88_09650 [Chlorobi bacterium]|nr:hypothetical protein [Chlorobiota bacterium]